FALQKQADAAAHLPKAFRLGQRRRTSDEVAQGIVELAFERGVAPQLPVRRFELVERRHERLRNVLAAELAEVAGAVGEQGHERLILSKSARSLPWSFTPGEVSTPLQRST